MVQTTDKKDIFYKQKMTSQVIRKIKQCVAKKTQNYFQEVGTLSFSVKLLWKLKVMIFSLVVFKKVNVLSFK